MIKEKGRKRHIAKTLTWRFVGTVDTILLSWFISGNPFSGFKIGLLEIITKTILYYFHERLWFKFKVKNSNKRHIVKTITWRFIGTIDTIIIAWFVTEDPLLGLQIGGVEVITKIFLYYLHERLWYKSSYGITNK